MAYRSTPPRAIDSPLVNVALYGALTLYPIGRAPRALWSVFVAVPTALGAGLGLLIGPALVTGRFNRSGPGPDTADSLDEHTNETPPEKTASPGTGPGVGGRTARAVADPRDPSSRTVIVTAAVAAGLGAAFGAWAWLSIAADRWIENRLVAAGARRPRLLMASSAALIGYMDARVRNRRDQERQRTTG